MDRVSCWAVKKIHCVPDQHDACASRAELEHVPEIKAHSILCTGFLKQLQGEANLIWRTVAIVDTDMLLHSGSVFQHTHDLHHASMLSNTMQLWWQTVITFKCCQPKLLIVLNQ